MNNHCKRSICDVIPDGLSKPIFSKKFKCDFDQCVYSSNNSVHLNIHKQIHTGEKAYKCEWSNCEYSCRTMDHLKRHNLTHTKTKSHKCTWFGCAFATGRLDNLKSHTLTHKNDKPFKCDYESCNYKCKRLTHLKNHKKIHMRKNIHKHDVFKLNCDSTKIQQYKCNWVNCNYICKSLSYLKKHKRTHTGEKPYKCDWMGCDYSCRDSSYIHKHKRIHTGEKPYKCDWIMCDYSCRDSSTLKKHKRIHTGEKPYKCDWIMCDYSCRDSSHLKCHINSMHSERGIQRKKKKEERIQKLLEEHKIHFDRELRVDFKCELKDDRGQDRAMVDFAIHREDGVIFLLEVDENEHGSYITKCEVRRMMDCYTSLMSGTEYKINNVVWIRYNPDKFIIDEDKQKVKAKDREQQLLNTINNYKPSGLMDILFLYYSRRWSDNAEVFIPLLFDDLDYPQHLKDCSKIIV
jgi:hypothetical protein